MHLRRRQRLKLGDGGYCAGAAGAVIIVLIWSWVRGSRLLLDKTAAGERRSGDLSPWCRARASTGCRAPPFFLTNNEGAAPSALMHNLKHNKVLHAQNFIVTVHTADTPRVDPDKALQIERLSDEITKVSMTFGFMETPNVPRLLSRCRKDGFEFDIMTTSFFLSHRSLKPADAIGHAALAGQAVRRPGRPRHQRHRLLPDPLPARGGDGDADPDLGRQRSTKAIVY